MKHYETVTNNNDNLASFTWGLESIIRIGSCKRKQVIYPSCELHCASVLGPLDCTYMEDVTLVFKRRTIKHCLFADDKLAYTCTCAPLRVVDDCTTDISNWCASRPLQLKTELASMQLTVAVPSNHQQLSEFYSIKNSAWRSTSREWRFPASTNCGDYHQIRRSVGQEFVSQRLD